MLLEVVHMLKAAMRKSTRSVVFDEPAGRSLWTHWTRADSLSQGDDTSGMVMLCYDMCIIHICIYDVIIHMDIHIYIYIYDTYGYAVIIHNL